MGIQQTAFYCKYIVKFSFFLIALWLFLAVPEKVLAYDSSLFMIEGVKIDVTAQNAVSAQEQAFEQAQLKAFNILAQRMVSEGDIANMSIPDGNIIASMIKDYEVTNEKISSIRYVGEYTFHFDPKTVGEYFSISGVQYTDTKSKPLLVLPVFQSEGETTIWGEKNLWLRTWAATRFGTSLVPVEVPIGDLDDVADINDDNALRFERKSLDRMLLRYNAREAAIMIAVPDKTLASLPLETDQASGSLRISIYRTDRGRAEYVSDFILQSESGQNVAQLYKRAARRGFKALQQNWKKRTATSAAQSRNYYLRMPVKNLSELVEVKNIIRTLPGFDEMQVISIKPREVRLLLIFRGTQERLRESLRSGSPYFLSDAYNMDEETLASSLSQTHSLRMMHDLYRRSSSAQNNRNILHSDENDNSHIHNF